MSSLKKTAKQLIRKSIEPACYRVCDVMKFAPPGHFYSPIPGEDDFAMIHNKKKLEETNNSLAGIDFGEGRQLEILNRIAQHYDKIPHFPDQKNSQFRFYYDNDYYSYPDATVMCCLFAELKPKKIIDVGGGNTTTLMMDIRDHLNSHEPLDITLIEPFPDRITKLFDGESTLTQIHRKIQDCDLDLFRSLESGDVLFLDTSHVSKMGSDVNYLVFNVLPVLQPGVIIHVHEMFFPFEYPQEFYSVGKSWNEIYLWRAFLTHNHSYQIMLFNSFLAKKHEKLLRNLMPDYYKRGRPEINVQNEGSALWMRKI